MKASPTNAIQTHQILMKQGLLPVLRTESKELARESIKAVLDAGFESVELTLTVPGAFELLQELCNEGAFLGAGTVLSEDQAAACIKAGAAYIVSPAFNENVSALCSENDVPYYPGALTPTEIVTAMQKGATMVKLFPLAELGGTGYLKSLRGPFPSWRYMVSGGIDLSNMQEWSGAGAAILGIGSSLFKGDLLQNRNWRELEALARRYLSVYRQGGTSLTV